MMWVYQIKVIKFLFLIFVSLCITNDNLPFQGINRRAKKSSCLYHICMTPENFLHMYAYYLIAQVLVCNVYIHTFVLNPNYWKGREKKTTKSRE